MNAAPLRALTAALIAATTSLASADTAQSPPIEAIWRIQTLPFKFYSLRTLYACDALERKVYKILQAVGAHGSSIVDAQCYGHDAVSSVSIRLVVATPVTASDENIRTMTTFTTEDEIVARLHRIALPTPDSLERFAATRKKIPLTRDRKLRLQDGDCDLLRDLNEQIFPKLSVQLLSTTNCNQTARLTRTNFEAEAWVPLPVEGQEPPNPPRIRDAVWTN